MKYVITVFVGWAKKTFATDNIELLWTKFDLWASAGVPVQVVL